MLQRIEVQACPGPHDQLAMEHAVDVDLAGHRLLHVRNLAVKSLPSHDHNLTSPLRQTAPARLVD
jgi:hypothetical protein